MSRRSSKLESTVKEQQQQHQQESPPSPHLSSESEEEQKIHLIDEHDGVVPSPSSASLSQKVLSSTANLANLLPTGTLLAFQVLTPIVTNNGSCDPATRSLTLILLLVLAASAFLACFTDSFRAQDGQVYYGMATRKGMWLFDYPVDISTAPPVDLSKYRLRFVDGVHAVLSLLVFGSVALREKNVVGCFYGPQPEHQTQEVLDIVPLSVGLLCSMLFVVFPTRRHGIGYPVNNGR